ncbi:MAG: colanic acid/amylovoran biosynthesis glycosyltransferase [Psychromonas sp.]|jgi:colanic acid/amylovoran biosynthesis glycosyltransferase|uniref:glycosyltransferase n=1 Tax=Psychromonas sp. TaxID=1884585 RepID=UPI0039E6F4EF
MKLAFFVSQFPIRSQTFVLNQITGLIDAGIDVSIISLSVGDKMLFTQGDHLAYQLADRTHYLTPPALMAPLVKFKHRLIKTLFGLVHPKTSKRTVKALTTKALGKPAQRLLLAAIAAQTKNTYQFDVILAHFGDNGITANNLRTLNVLQGKLVTVFHGYELSVKQTLLANRANYQRLFAQGELMLPISEIWQEKLIKIGCSSDKVRVHRMGVDLTHFPYQRALDTVLRSIELTKTPPVLTLFTVARFTQKKGIIYALEALALVLGLTKTKAKTQQFPLNSPQKADSAEQPILCHYRLAGFGEELGAIKQAIDDLGLSPFVTLLGPLNSAQVQEELIHADVFLQPSITANNGDMEGIPVSIMEAMAVGTVVLSTYHSGIPELITHGEQGLLAPEKSSLSLADNIRLLYHDIPLREKLTANARQKIAQVGDVKTLNKQLLDILNVVLSQTDKKH